ncbi:hypothetical protein BKA70DRAFT_1433790 [Coprinopsis sp. MPI-PUGE-AT-0042]|nr:hypothetical protein BKA70DRAFT_1433790 [Coprinopsis sp. MPI-PUGE-AT-0042]
MHRCLKIEEILKSIFLEVLEDECPPGPRPSRRSPTVARLARTCKSFRNPALAVLWQEVFGIVQLLSVLPAKKLKWEHPPLSYSRAVMKLAHPPTADEWGPFFEYSALVKHLHQSIVEFKVPGLKGLRSVDVDIGTLSAIPSNRTLFPSLQKLSLKWEGCGLPLYHLLLSPNLWSLTLTFEYDPILYGFLQKVGDYGHNIRSITLKNNNHEGRIRYIPSLPLKDAIVDMTRMVEVSALHVDLPPQTFDIVSGSAVYSNLRVLEIGHATAKIETWFPLKRLEFPNLTRFVLLSPEGPNLDSVQQLVLRCDCPSLESLDLHILGATPPEQSLRSFFKCIAIKRDRHSTLRRVALIQRSEILNEGELEAPDMRIQLETLRPLLSLGLSDIELDIPSYFALDDSDYHKIADSCVELRCLTLERPSYQRRGRYKATLASLTHFSSLCPSLEILNIPFEPTFTQDVSWDAAVQTESVLKTLYVRYSELSHISGGEVAAYLSGLFPKLASVKSIPGRLYSVTHASWTEVNLLLPRFAKVRQQEQLKAEEAQKQIHEAYKAKGFGIDAIPPGAFYHE